jgi:hypothetical protein
MVFIVESLLDRAAAAAVVHQMQVLAAGVAMVPLAVAAAVVAVAQLAALEAKAATVL